MPQTVASSAATTPRDHFDIAKCRRSASAATSRSVAQLSPQGATSAPGSGARSQGARCADAGDFLLRVMGQGAAAYSDFVASRSPPPLGPPLQPIERAVHHLCCYLVRCLPQEKECSDVHELGLRVSVAVVRDFSDAGGKTGRPKARRDVSPAVRQL